MTVWDKLKRDLKNFDFKNLLSNEAYGWEKAPRKIQPISGKNGRATAILIFDS